MSVHVHEENAEEDLYHLDFTTASPWEVFIARIEECIYQWKLTNLKHKNLLKCGEFSKLTWKYKHEIIEFADTKFKLSWHSGEKTEGEEDGPTEDNIAEDTAMRLDCIEEMMQSEHDFVPVLCSEDDTIPHVLARWYGLRDFIVLTPLQGGIISESKIKTLVSSFYIAANNTKCEVPIFVRALEPWQKFYLGVCCGQGVRVNFDMVHLKKIPHQCKHLTGLSNIFKSKIAIDNSKIENVTAAVRFSYLLKNWTSYMWGQEPPYLDLSDQNNISQLATLPVGSASEPLSGMTLNAVWQEVLENVVIDNEGYSDFDPNQAPLWTLSITKADNMLCFLSDYLQEFILFCNFNGTAEDLLGDLILKDSSAEYAETLSSLTESRIPKLSDLLFLDTSAKKCEEPIPRNILLPILYYLFPDTESSQRHPYILKEDDSQTYKTCPEDSLVWRLSLAMAHVLYAFGGAKAATHLWHEFSQELRFRWNSSTLIPGVNNGVPHPKTCLLYQKLQMINCCIEKKLEREKLQEASQDTDESEDDEFFDCDSDGGEGDEGKSQPRVSLWNTPTGRQERHPTLKLINNRQPLYIPRTQGKIPKTEDQVEEINEILLSLGPGAEGTLLRAKLMSASLLSDMESFKAANPGAIMEDFIRWYSPRDWIEKDEVNEFGEKIGELSPRMLLPGNTWMEVWGAAKPVPAKRQKRLFDETKEVERALHFVESALPAEAGRLLLPVVTHAAVTRLSSEVARLRFPLLHASLERLDRKAQNRSRQNFKDINIYQDMVLEVKLLEMAVTQVKSLEQKFQVECSRCPFIEQLMTLPEAEVPGGPLGGPISARIKAMFSEAHKVDQMLDVEETEGSSAKADDRGGLLSAYSKEFVLRARAGGGTLAHRLTAFVTKNDITMAGAFSQGTVFF